MRQLIITILLLFSGIIYADEALEPESIWYQTEADGTMTLKLWFFWSERCPHCLEAKPVIEKLATDNPWLKLESRQLVNNIEYQQQYLQIVAPFDKDARSVPAFFFCNTMLVGFESEATTGLQILKKLNQCRSDLALSKVLPEQSYIDEETLLSEVEASLNFSLEGVSLPVITLIIAGLDAFNPCAFFILLFLLSLMIHLQSRKRMLLIGGIFVLFSGLVYYLFMAAWLNIFLMFGAIQWATLIAGVVAITMAVLNIKDYFLTSDVSLSLSDKAKSGIFQRMRNLLNADNAAAMLISTIVLAIVANSYELLCTSGLPMIYTRLLTLEQLPTSVYYTYLLAYNVIYIVPLLLIVIIFVVTLGRRKLKVNEGRSLKLLSGLMMLGLGMLLIFAPDQLSNLMATSGIILTSILITLFAYFSCK